MTWKRINRTTSGHIAISTANVLKDYESSSIVFWNSYEDIAEMCPSDHLLIIDTDPAYTHYMILTPPKIDRRRKEYRKGGER